MAWKVTNQSLSMAEGDYGIAVPMRITGVPFGEQDSIRFTFKTEMNGEIVLEKTFSDIRDGTVDLEFTEAESGLFPVGSYVYSVDWYQSGRFMCNLVPASFLKVVDKA